MKKKKWLTLYSIFILFISINLLSSSLPAVGSNKGTPATNPVTKKTSPPPLPSKASPVSTQQYPPSAPAKVQSKPSPQAEVKPLPPKTVSKPHVKPATQQPPPRSHIKPSGHQPSKIPTIVTPLVKPTIPLSVERSTDASGRHTPPPSANSSNQIAPTSAKPSSSSHINNNTSVQRKDGGKQEIGIPDKIVPTAQQNGKRTFNSNLQKAFGRPSAALGIVIESGISGQEGKTNESTSSTAPDASVGKTAPPPSDGRSVDSIESGREGTVPGRPLTESEKDKVRATLGIPEGAEFTSATDVNKFIQDAQLIGADLSQEDWERFGQGNGEEVLTDKIRENFGIPLGGTEGRSPAELFGLGEAGQQIGVIISPEFVHDYNKTLDGTMSVGDLIDKWGFGGGLGSVGTGSSTGSSSPGSSSNGQNTGSANSGLPDSHDFGSSTGTPGSGSSRNGGATGHSTASDLGGSSGDGNVPGTDANSSTLGSSNTGTNTEGDNNGTRDMNLDTSVVDMDVDSPSTDSDHNDYENNPSSTTSPVNEGTGSTADETNSSASDINGSYSEDAASLRTNNDTGNPDTGIFTVEGIGSSTEPDSLQAGRVGDVTDFDSASPDGYAENDDGVIAGYGMSGPDRNDAADEDDKDDGTTTSTTSTPTDTSTNSDNNDTDDTDDSDDSDDTSNDNSSDNSSDDNSSDDNSSDGSSDDNSSDGSNDSSSEGSEDSESTDDSGRPNPIGDEQGGGPTDPTTWLINHDEKAVFGQPGNDGKVPVDASTLEPIEPMTSYRRGEEKVIHTTGDEVTGESPVPVDDSSVQLNPSNLRGSIQLPSDAGENAPPGTNLLPGHSSGNDNPGDDGDPRTRDDD